MFLTICFVAGTALGVLAVGLGTAFRISALEDRVLDLECIAANTTHTIDLGKHGRLDLADIVRANDAKLVTPEDLKTVSEADALDASYAVDVDRAYDERRERGL